MKVGGSLGSEGIILSALRVRACSRVSGCPSLGNKSKFRCSRMPCLTGHLAGCGGADPHNHLTSAFSAQSELFSP